MLNLLDYMVLVYLRKEEASEYRVKTARCCKVMYYNNALHQHGRQTILSHTNP